MPTPCTPASGEAAPTVREFVHRYPWRRQEVAIIGALLTAPSICTALLGGWGTVGPWVGIGVGAALGLFLCHLGKSRKDGSARRATLDGTMLRVEPAKNGRTGTQPSTGNLADMVVVRVTGTHRVDPTLTFETAPNDYGTTRSVSIPMRLARVMAADLAPHLTRVRKAGNETAQYVGEILDLAEGGGRA